MLLDHIQTFSIDLIWTKLPIDYVPLIVLKLVNFEICFSHIFGSITKILLIFAKRQKVIFVCWNLAKTVKTFVCKVGHNIENIVRFDHLTLLHFLCKIQNLINLPNSRFCILTVRKKFNDLCFVSFQTFSTNLEQCYYFNQILLILLKQVYFLPLNRNHLCDKKINV